MSALQTSSATICVFLCTYLLHSTLAVVLIGIVARRLRRSANPELRVLMWKTALLLPLVTTLAATVLNLPHFGLQIPLARVSAAVQSEHSRGSDAFPLPMTGLHSKLASMTVNSSRGSDEVSSAQLNPSVSATSMFVPSPPQSSSTRGWIIVVAIWVVCTLIGLAGLSVQVWRLRRFRNQASVVTAPDICDSLRRLKQQLNVGRRVDLLQSADSQGPMTAGILRPFIMIPDDVCWSSTTAGQTNDCAHTGIEGQPSVAERDALLAHELVHIARRDALWNLMIQLIGRVFPFQPLNWIAGRQLRQEMDFVADSQAARTLGERSGMAVCLLRLGDRFASQRPNVAASSGLAACMASFQSTLGQRIEILLNEHNDLRPSTRARRTSVLALIILGACLTASLVPRVVAQLPDTKTDSHSTLSQRNNSMNRTLSTLAILGGLVMPATADEPQEKPANTATSPVAELRATPDALPEGIAKFNGMLVGRLAAKDIEKGTFVVQVDAVPRVWQNSGSVDPKSIVGKSVQVHGVFGKFLDVLVVTRTGETVEFECKHDGDRLVFPGELLRKVAPYDSEDYPVLPEEFRGFQGAVAAEVIKKDPETFELIVKVHRVTDTRKENTAKQPKSIEGRQMMLAGFWNRKDAYHNLKVGDRVELGVKHIGLRSDHLTVAEFVRKSEQNSNDEEMKKDSDAAVESGLSKEMRGFRGMLVGRLVEKDIERGTFTITVDAVPRVWNNNKASIPKNMIGQNVSAEGVSGKMLDALVVAKAGETIEFGALHDGGGRMRVGEVLRKVAPVEPGDYPELPEGFRGFKGMVVGKVVRKDEHLMEFIIEINLIEETFPASHAKNPETIIGHQAILAGFWQRKDAFHDINVGDSIQCGIDHPQRLSDHLTVIESVKKIDK